MLTPQLKLTSVKTGLVGSAALAGLFIGSLIFGYVTDIVGRKLMFILNLIVFVVGSVLQFFITDATQLIILRFIMGVAVGRVVAIETTLRPY